MLRFSFINLVLLVTVFGAHLPNYFRKCSLSDPKLSKCITKTVTAAWPTIVQGDNSSHIQVLDPLYVPFMHFPIHENLRGNVTEALIYGLADMKINEIKINVAKKTFDIRCKVPRFSLVGNYDVAGQILGSFPIYGQGVVNFTIFDMENQLHIDYELTEKGKKHYITAKKNHLVYTTTKLSFHLTNLFGGDNRLGDMTNQIMNENWEAMNKEVGSKVGEVFSETFTEITKGFFKRVPIEEIFSN